MDLLKHCRPAFHKSRSSHNSVAFSIFMSVHACYI
uniref:Uncharacterized protein n=1 Tax=Arundo donax TaxID=35708 RepID=A0A0A9BKW4_ARUDO